MRLDARLRRAAAEVKSCRKGLAWPWTTAGAPAFYRAMDPASPSRRPRGPLAVEPALGAGRLAPQIGAGIDPGHARGVALVALAGVFWSLGGLLIRLIEAANGWQIVLFRSIALALTLSLVIALRHRGRVVSAFRDAGWNGVAAGFALGGGFIGFVLALQNTSVANATFMLGASPFLAAALGRAVLGETIRRATALAMAAALAGILVMVGGGLVIGTIRGNLLALGASVGFAIFSVLLRRGRERDMLPCVVIAGVISALIALPVVLAGAPALASALALSPRDLALCAAMGAITVGGGLTVYTLGARHVPVAELTLLSMTELALAPIWVWLAVGEVPSGYTLLGGAIIIGAITAQALSGARRRRPLPMV
jgi:drug/metabolite transporter, DME family